MEILQLLTSFLNNNQNLKVIAPIVEILRANNFDIKKALSSLTPEMIKPIVEQFSMMQNNKNSFSEQSNGLTPISNIADKDIVYCLNRYLSSAN